MAFAIFYWLLLWRKVVDWTGWRITGTVLTVLGSIGIATAFGTLLAGRGDEEVGIILGTLFASIAWLVATVMIWRETPGERANRMRLYGKQALFCPKCGYNLTGLYEARCPECGAKYTLDELVASQQRDQVEDVSVAREQVET